MDTANRVRDYHTAKFGGVNHKGARVHYNEDDKQAAKVLAFVRNWITHTKGRGVLKYQKRGAQVKSIGKASEEAKTASRWINVAPIDMEWETFAESSLNAHLTKLSDPDIGRKPAFNPQTIESLRDHFAFDEALLETLEPPDSDDELQDVPLTQFVEQFEYTLTHSELVELQEKRDKKKRDVAAGRPATRGAKRGRGRPRKEAPREEVQPAAAAKRGRGRPKGSKNVRKPIKGQATALSKGSGKRKTFTGELSAEVFDSRDEDSPAQARFGS